MFIYSSHSFCLCASHLSNKLVYVLQNWLKWAYFEALTNMHTEFICRFTIY